VDVGARFASKPTGNRISKFECLLLLNQWSDKKVESPDETQQPKKIDQNLPTVADQAHSLEEMKRRVDFDGKLARYIVEAYGATGTPIDIAELTNRLLRKFDRRLTEHLAEKTIEFLRIKG
jgi:hypothetical protein